MALMIPKATSDISRGQPLNAEWWRFFKSVEVSLNAGGLAEQLAAIQKELAELSEPGILPVKSVNRKYGAVILDAGDVGADPAGAAAAAVAAHVLAADPHPQYTTEAEAAAAAPVQSVNGETGGVVLDASDVGADPVGSASSAVSAHVAASDPHTQYFSKPTGSSAEFLRGDGTSSPSIGTGLFYDELNRRLGVGESSPAYTLSLKGPSAGIQVNRTGGLPFAQFIRDGDITVGFQLRGMSAGLSITSADASTTFVQVSSTYVRPGVDNAQTLGGASNRWSTVYAATGTINTSDAREKTTVRPLTASELAAAAELGSAVGAYQWLAMIAEKGDAAREHIGMTVQGAIAILESHGLDPFAYGFICYDQWDELPEVVGEEGEVAQEYRAAGDRYSFRMDELLAFIARGLAHRLDTVEQRLAAAGL
ncbi:tail fiber domain-containing protein [Stenotrophomonas sp. UBA7606]|uniref:tail fiber domain-containing protein n=1 Tax=Stenotrophomonas sp. UBA7606 TaxID=1947559 RepID=UPI0025F40BB1|nr:tail fiber domain-containing protein [Stenotrophomonas sp. UBA7606]